MKPQKKSIRDFFSPAPTTSQEMHKSTPLQKVADAISAQTLQPVSSSTSRGLADPIPIATSTSPPIALDLSTATTAPTMIRAASTEAQPPNPSQNSANSGASKRVVSNGEQVVLNSDSDTDSLPDLDWGEPKTSSKAAASATRIKRTSEDDDDALRKPEKKGKSGKRSFNALVQSAQQNVEIERKIMEQKADLNKSLDAPSTTNLTINEDVLGQAVEPDDNDPEKAHRLLLAMQRTNVTQSDSVFLFFRNTSDSIPIQAIFPFATLPKHRWASNFEDLTLRDQAFLTGFAQQIFRVQELPEEIASWMLDQVCFDRDEVLNSKYLEILDFHPEHIRTLLNRDRINAIFRAAGADVESLSSDTELVPSSDAHSISRPPLPPSLKSIAKVLQKVAPWLHNKARSHALYLLCHACLDDRVIVDSDVLATVQDAIEAILCNFDDSQRLTYGLNEIVPQLLLRVKHPILQRNLVRALPAKSPLTAYFQRYLALSLLLQPTAIVVPLADLKVPMLVHKYIDMSPSLQINKSTNYAHLAAHLTLLDIAVGPGLLPVPYHPLVSPTASPAGSSPIMAPFPISSEVKDFNKEIDALARHVKILGNSIVEAGAVVDLTILDAKDCIERLCSRLEHAARIGGKKVHNVFGDGDEDKQSRVNKFFSTTRRTGTPTLRGNGIFDKEDNAGIKSMAD